MGCCVGFSKCWLLFINSVYQLTGCTLIGLGIWLIYTQSLEENTAHVINEVYFVPIFFISLGCIVFLISSFGFWGAARNNTSLLKIYAWILLVVLFFKMTVAIYVGVHSYRDLLDRHFPQLKLLFDKYGIYVPATVLVDKLQSSLACCGYDDPYSMRFANGTYPWSCCGVEPTTCTLPVDKSCVEGITEIATPLVFGIGVIYYTVLGIQIVCAIAAFHVSSSMTKRHRKPPYYRFDL